MKRMTRIATLAALTTATAGLLAAPATAAPAQRALAPHHAAGTGSPGSDDGRSATNGVHALFVQTDEVSGNHVVAYRQHDDGSLTLQNTYATGGNGGVLPNSVIDHTASQGAVTYDEQHQLLYVVNAGSNTISVFAVHGTDLQLRQVIGSGGTFPVSIAVRGAQVFVANAQQGGSIQGFLVAGGRLISIPQWNRPLGLDPTLTNFTQTPGQVAFSPRGDQLLVTTKGNRHSVEVFSLGFLGTPADVPVETVIPGTAPFAIAFDQRGNALVTDGGAAASVITLALSHSGSLTVLSTVPTGQRGTCWVVRDGKFAFTTNPGGPSVSSLALTANGVPNLLGATPTDPGTVDAAVSHDGRYLYVETGAGGIIDQFAVNGDGSLTEIGTTPVANAAGAEGLATT
jgi:hypothetical protein